MDDSYGGRVAKWMVVLMLVMAGAVVLVLAWHALHSVLWPVPVGVAAFIVVALIGAWLWDPDDVRIRKENHNPPPANTQRPTKLPVTAPPKRVCRHCGEAP